MAISTAPPAVVAQGLGAYPNEPRLQQLQATLQRGLAEKQRQTARIAAREQPRTSANLPAVATSAEPPRAPPPGDQTMEVSAPIAQALLTPRPPQEPEPAALTAKTPVPQAAPPAPPVRTPPPAAVALPPAAPPPPGAPPPPVPRRPVRPPMTGQTRRLLAGTAAAAGLLLLIALIVTVAHHKKTVPGGFQVRHRIALHAAGGAEIRSTARLVEFPVAGRNWRRATIRSRRACRATRTPLRPSPWDRGPPPVSTWHSPRWPRASRSLPI